MNDKLEIFKEIIPKVEVVILKKDLRKVAKEYQMTRKNLIKKLNRNGYEYDRRAKGYICLDSNTELLRNDCITSNYNTDKLEELYKMNILLLEKMSESNTKNYTYDSDVIEADIKLVADFNNKNYKQTSIKVNEEVWEDFNRNCKENHKQLDKQELISIALRDFNLKYNK